MTATPDRRPRRITAGLYEARTDRGLTLAALARLADCHPVYIGQVERGERTPSAQMLLRIATALGVDLDAISTREPLQDAA